MGSKLHVTYSPKPTEGALLQIFFVLSLFSDCLLVPFCFFPCPCAITVLLWRRHLCQSAALFV